jgi:hypothetical protein
MAFADHAEVVSVEHTQRMSLQAPETALRLFTFGSHVRARLVWFNPDAATPAKDDAPPAGKPPCDRRIHPRKSGRGVGR